MTTDAEKALDERLRALEAALRARSARLRADEREAKAIAKLAPGGDRRPG